MFECIGIYVIMRTISNGSYNSIIFSFSSGLFLYICISTSQMALIFASFCIAYVDVEWLIGINFNFIQKMFKKKKKILIM